MGEHGSAYSRDVGIGGLSALEGGDGKGGTGMKRLTFLIHGNEDDWEEGANSSSTLGRGGSELRCMDFQN